ncbi:TetR/AcrR family transcriptional regulator [Dermabacter sp. p3-SID358]|uniref:TetR/AcrR family transcriptional regulator n=1 Tax=Dermabacter sp. p3-SID358 TaxID=2916114 RepID=UPI0021A5A9C9|nr:TetR/AcrR family transcriptional regulator [Dermabacter sp. p3-SID358]MCT1866363.1 TetR/AcrR family transcriptional regulator [Dermabacter sp. p3-SID358]
MPRTSKKEFALKVAYHLVTECGGVDGLTFDSLAEASGMSKSGLIYHFPSRHELLVELHRYAAHQWERELLRVSEGRAPQDLTPAERERALVSAVEREEPLAEILLNIHSLSHRDYEKGWDEVDERWLMNPSEDVESDEDLDRLEDHVLSAGLWVYNHLSGRPLSEANRAKLVARLIERGKAREKRS